MPGKRILIVFNPISGRGTGPVEANYLAQQLQADGHTAILLESQISQSENQSDPLFESAELVILCGGDGTLQKLLPTLVRIARPIFMWPSGNESLFAVKFAMRADIHALQQAIANWKVSKHFVPTVHGTMFFTMISAGLDSEVIAAISKWRDGPITRWSYVLPTIRAALRHQVPQVTLLVDGQPQLNSEFGFLIIANTTAYAGGLEFVPEADSRRDILSARFFPYRSVLQYAIWTFNSLSRTKVELGNSRYFEGKEFVLEINGENGYPLQADGEASGRTPATIRAGESQLMVLESALP